ncbi:hypothetical protein SAMN02745195_00463 [Thermoanaerobacter uzonensis DSM 18761]|uniref:DUF8042 domain-containing protein n=1 Tax=Thermoanaerobacter uzonensis DSM 18761 TaxID=1123369 RepID=A0A1M4TRN0_9THEO|nr:hypothetical protein [Thermoanaerobacter uzonensis]SHE47150.1 hypothetical protein SAMN02745195_00463 [Thermoanaerobacter uzonensis DSM 18761]
MVNELMKETMEESFKYIPKLIKGIDKEIEYINNGEYEEAISLLTNIIEGLDWSIQAITLTESLHGFNIDIYKTNENLNILLEAIENSDYQLISDILNYELKAILYEYINHCQKGELN